MRLDELTRAIQSRGEKALVAFLTAGYPDEATFLELVRTAASSGCTAIEIGIPFSDPIADGPLIQESSKCALDAGITLKRCFDLAEQLTPEVEVPLLFMSYYNPILRMGPGRFAERAASAGLAGVIIPDVPFEESAPIRSVVRRANLDFIDLIAPTTSEERIERITAEAEGFLYLVSVTGVTGVRSPEAEGLEKFVGRVRGRTGVPLYVGFGISSPARAQGVVRYADGVIIGSALIQIIRSSASRKDAVEKVGGFLRVVRSAIHEPFGGRRAADRS